jgi:hypothetical protein
MRICLKRENFFDMDDRQLLWTCIEPVIVRVRGKSYAFKNEFSRQLTEGQRALLMFEVLFGHTSAGVVSFYENFSYLLVHPGFWAELKKGIAFFQDEPLLGIVTELERLYNFYYAGDSTLSESADKDFIMRDAGRLDTRFKETFPGSIERIARHIRENPSDYVDFAGQVSS